MPAVLVCPLSQIARTVAQSNASHLVSVINTGTPVERPASIAAANHLFLGVNDITEAQDGMVLPGEEHVAQLIDFAGQWPRERPMVIHCFAGISRSTAAAFVTLALAAPKRDEGEIATALRAASPTATPNMRIVAIADALMGRQGRMVRAIEAIGRGADTYEGVPFRVNIEAG